jgi:hypothetical protein
LDIQFNAFATVITTPQRKNDIAHGSTTSTIPLLCTPADYIVTARYMSPAEWNMAVLKLLRPTTKITM